MPSHVFSKLSNFPMPHHPPVRFISLGRPLHWKGFELGIRAFAKSQLEAAEYWLVCNGPERKTYVRLVERLHLTDRVRLIEKLPTLDDVYMVLSQAHILVHPALHEAFGNVVLEALAAGKPVICLDLGGPATQVSEDVGFKIPAHTVEQVIGGLAEAMRKLATDHMMREQIRQAALDRVASNYLSNHTEKLFALFYEETVKGLINGEPQLSE
jgi:glycosyltransferase involved in cell wall biosynthesis